MSAPYSTLELEQVDQNQGGNYLSSNEADDQLGGALAAPIAITITTADLDYTTTDLKPDALYHRYFKFTGTMDAPHNFIVPDNAKPYKIDNGATDDITVKTTAGTGITVAAGTSSALYCDGVNVIQEPGGGLSSVDASVVTYTPATLGDWTGAADPGNADDALDQLAGRVETLESSGGLSAVADGDVLANISGGSAVPTGNTLTAILDHILSSSEGAIIIRGASGWVALAPGTSGNFLKTQGAGADPIWDAVSGLSSISDKNLLANISGSSAVPTGNTLTGILDNILGSTRGMIIFRGASAWSALSAGTSGQFLETKGTSADPQWTSEPYDVGATFLGQPFSSAVILRYPMPRAVVFPASMTDSKAVCGTAPAADTTYSIQKNGSEFATFTIASGATTGTFTSASGATFAAGDILTIVAPSTEDTALADLGVTLAGTR